MPWCSFKFPLWATSSCSASPTTNQSTATVTATPTLHQHSIHDQEPEPCPIPTISSHPAVAHVPPSPSYGVMIPAPTALSAPPPTLQAPSGTSMGLAARRRRPLLTLPLATAPAATPLSTPSPSRFNTRHAASSSASLAGNTRPLSQAVLLSPILLLPSPKSPHAIIEREARLTPSDPRMLSLSPRTPAPTATCVRRLGVGSLRQGHRSPVSGPTLFDDWDAWEDSAPLRPPRYGDHRGSRRIGNAEADAWWASMMSLMDRQQPNPGPSNTGALGQDPPAYNTIAILDS